MSLIPNIDFTLIDTLTLNPLTFVDLRQYYWYDFGAKCINTTATTSITLCNLTPDPISFDYFDNPDPINIYHPNMSGVTIGAYGTYTYNIGITPTLIDAFSPIIYFSGTNIEIKLRLVGSGVESLLVFDNSDCFIDFGTVGLSSEIVTTKDFVNISENDITITFSGALNNYSVVNPITLIPGSNLLSFTFNPQTIGPCVEDLLILGDCIDHPIRLCGYSMMAESVTLSFTDNSSYIGCCSMPQLTIYNNHISPLDDTIKITNITYPSELIIDSSVSIPFFINKASCAIINFDFCPLITGITSSFINVEYQYDHGTEFTGHSEIQITLSAFTHPFNNVSLTCIPFHCKNANNEAILTLTNSGNKPFEFYYYYQPTNEYDYYNVFSTQPDSPYIIPPNTTTGLTINFNSNYLTTADTFSELFHLKLVDPKCCKELSKCVDVNFCPTTISVDNGYPINVSCYGGCDGQYSFSVNDCSGGYHISWSSDTQNILENHYDQLSAIDLCPGNYLLTITNICSATTYYNFTITQPDPLFVEVHWKNPANYCKKDLAQLCGIVPPDNLNPSGYVVMDRETLIKVVSNDNHDIKGQTKRGYQQYDARENQIAQGQEVGAINSFRNYVLNFFSKSFAKYKTKWEREEIITLKSWDEIVSDTLGQGCCFASYVSGGTSPYTYHWYGPNGYTEISPNIYNRPCCTPHTLVVIDANGCQMSATSTCLNCTFGIETLIIENPSCVNATNGDIFVSVSGNCLNSAFQIELESNTWIDTHTATTYNFGNLSNGDYILRIKNLETECDLKPINITLRPKYDFIVTTNITGTTCEQSCNGTIEIIVTVINNEDHIDPEFLYTLDGHYQTSNIFSGICSGDHELNVMNTINYCEVTQTVNVPNLNLFQVITETTPASSKGSSDGTITITVIDGVSLCDDYECYELIDLQYMFDVIANSLIHSEDGTCIIWSEDGICPIDVEPFFTMLNSFLHNEDLTCELISEDGICSLDVEPFYNAFNAIIHSEIDDCEILNENNVCSIDVEYYDPNCGQYVPCDYHIPCDNYTTFINHSFTISKVKPGKYCFILKDKNGCFRMFCAIVGYTEIKKKLNKGKHFDSKRIDVYGGSKIKSNTPKGQ